MKQDNIELFDILWEIDLGESLEKEEMPSQNISTKENNSSFEIDEKKQDFIITDDSHLFFEEEKKEENKIEIPLISEEKSEEKTEKIKKEKQEKNIFSLLYNNSIFIIKYLSTSALIFMVLLLTTNYSAYYNVAMWYFYAEDFKQKSQSLLNSVEASSLSEHLEKKIIEEKKQEDLYLQKGKTQKTEKFNSIETLASKTRRTKVDLGITITPYENRIVIPKIGKNIPLLDIKQKTVDGIEELNDIFMEELENGVIRYPGSAKPWEDGTTFVFGHSSNFPWIKWDYNQVFALLDKVVFNDEIIVYYNQKTYTYKIRKKEIIKPGHVGVLKRNKGRSEITLMTCWPIGTTLNRMIVIGDLVDIK